MKIVINGSDHEIKMVRQLLHILRAGKRNHKGVQAFFDLICRCHEICPFRTTPAQKRMRSEHVASIEREKTVEGRRERAAADARFEAVERFRAGLVNDSQGGAQ